ncbi:MAG TPA: hypothetical protein VGB02_14450 [Pyrinomonadaceae bacterium]|jgi:hypothetical protein
MYSDNWTDKFIKEKLANHDNIDSIIIENRNYVRISRKEGTSFLTFTMSLEYINHEVLTEIIDSNDEIDFIVNIKKEYRLSEKSFDILYSNQISFGGVGDFMRFANQWDNIFYTDQEFQFVSRALEQHDKVTSIKRLDNKRIQIERDSLEDVIIVMNNDYDLNIESVRSLKSKFADFKVMVSTNPSARVTSDAYEIAKTMDVDLCTWRDFLAKLNTFWN